MRDGAFAISLPESPVVAIGVTGHRLERLDPARIAEIEAAAAAALTAIEQAAAQARTPARFRLVTGLADGADSIVAELAMRKGWPVDAILAFPRDEFAEDFAEGAARTAHEDRMARVRTVFELPGHRAADGSGLAYERVGHTVLAQCDILLAIWDNAPARGRGGAAQIVADAVLCNIPVVQIDPSGATPATLCWDGLEEHDLGPQSVETVARGGLDRLPALLADLIDPPDDDVEIAHFGRFTSNRPQRAWLAFGYPLLLSVAGVAGRSRGRASDVEQPALPGTFAAPAAMLLADRYARADRIATHFARVFRSGYVTNFSFAALAVVLSLLGLALPSGLKPVLVILEISTIAAILLATRIGNRAGWHRQWLDSRQLAERLRCLAVSAQLGDLQLRGSSGGMHGWVDWFARDTARAIGLPAARVDAAYVARVRGELTALIDGQIAYLTGESSRMHRLEHRLHRTGTALFVATALVCVALLVFKIAAGMVESALIEEMSHPLVVAATILSAALPAIGAAIYGIRMQGDFAGTSERSETLAHRLTMLRRALSEDDDGFDTLLRRVRRATDLLTEDLASWLATYHARPLALPG